MTDSIEVTEINLPTNLRSRMAAAVWSAMQFADQFTDILIHEDSLISIKSIGGTIPLASLGIPGTDFIVEKADFMAFLCGHIAGESKNTDATKYWADNIHPTLAQGKSINRSIKTPTGIYIRINLFRFQGGKFGMVVRITHAPRPVEKSGIPNDLISRITEGAKGLLILTGPTASGKTASALSILDHLNNKSRGHIVTIEDPIEYVMTARNCAFTQRGVGDDVHSFAAGLHEALRQCPDVLLVGEVRDRETAETAILASESGCLVIITTHGQTTTGALRKLTYLLGDQSARAMLSVMSGSLLGVYRQELVPQDLGSEKGYSMVCDSLNNTAHVRSLIEKGNLEEIERLQIPLRSEHHTSMNVQLNQMVKLKKISEGQAIRHSTNKTALREVMTKS